MPDIAWDIRREGRKWTAEEAELRSCHAIPDRPEIHNGMLYFTDEERLAVVACLLENLGLDRVVRSLGLPELWQEAIKTAKQEKHGDPDKDPLKALADRAAKSLADLDRQLEEFFDELQQINPGIAERAIAKAGGRDLAALLLFCPSKEFGNKSALQLWAEGKASVVRELLSPGR